MQSLITLTCLVFTSIKLSIADSIIKYLFSDFLIIASLLIVLIGSKQVYDIPWGKRLYFCDIFRRQQLSMFKSRQVLPFDSFSMHILNFIIKLPNQIKQKKSVHACGQFLTKSFISSLNMIKPFLIQYYGTCDTLKGRIYWIRLHAGPDIFPPHHFYNLE